MLVVGPLITRQLLWTLRPSEQPSAATVLAAALQPSFLEREGLERIGLVLSGGNVDLAKLPASFAGRRWDGALLDALPPGVDPCGENGELHTFATAGPMFARPIPVEVGGIEQREGFAYADLRRVSP